MREYIQTFLPQYFFFSFLTFCFLLCFALSCYGFVYFVCIFALRCVHFIMIFAWWETFRFLLIRTRDHHIQHKHTLILVIDEWMSMKLALKRLNIWNMMELVYFDSYWSNCDTSHQYIHIECLELFSFIRKTRRMYRNLAVNSKYWMIHWCLCEQHADVYDSNRQSKKSETARSIAYCFYCALWLSIVSYYFDFSDQIPIKCVSFSVD